MTRLLLALLLVWWAQPALALDIKDPALAPVEETSKILGGVQAAPGAWPWIAALLYGNDSNVFSAQFCSGVLIDKSWVLTAAHCVQGMSAPAIQVAVGAYDLTRFTGSRTPVKSIRIHPQFSSTSLYNDIALVELSVPSSIQPIALFSGESVDNTPPSLLGRLVTVLGGGATLTTAAGAVNVGLGTSLVIPAGAGPVHVEGTVVLVVTDPGTALT